MRKILLATVFLAPFAAHASGPLIGDTTNNIPTATAGASAAAGASANQAQGQLQGQIQGQQQGQGQAQSVRNSVRNTNANLNANTNVNSVRSSNTNLNAASANNRVNASSANSVQQSGATTTVTGDSYTSTGARVPASTAYAPTVMNVNPCIVPMSVGGQGMTFGFSVGTGLRDAGCALDRRAQILIQSGQGDVAAELFCQDEATRNAYRSAGRPCMADRPQRLAAVETAPAPVQMVQQVPTVIEPPAGPVARTMVLPDGRVAFY